MVSADYHSDPSHQPDAPFESELLPLSSASTELGGDLARTFGEIGLPQDLMERMGRLVSCVEGTHGVVVARQYREILSRSHLRDSFAKDLMGEGLYVKFVGDALDYLPPSDELLSVFRSSHGLSEILNERPELHDLLLEALRLTNKGVPFYPSDGHLLTVFRLLARTQAPLQLLENTIEYARYLAPCDLERIETAIIELEAQAAAYGLARGAVPDHDVPVLAGTLHQMLGNDYKLNELYYRDSRTRKWQPTPYLELALGVQRRLDNVFHGFNAYTHLARALPDGTPAFITRFGRKHGEAAFVHSEDKNAFPGKGFVVRGLTPESLFTAREEGQDPLQMYREAWPHLAEELFDLRSTEFYFFRGMLAIVPLNDEKYSFKNVNGDMQHFAAVFFNDHFYNLTNLKGMLVPVEMFDDLVGPCVVPVDGYDSSSTDACDVNERIEFPEELFDNHPLSDQVIPIGTGSLLTRGFSGRNHRRWVRYLTASSNRTERKKSPLRRWVEGLSTARGENPSSRAPRNRKDQFEKVFQTLRRDMTDISDPQTEAHKWDKLGRYFHLLDLFNLGLAAETKGLTLDGGQELDGEPTALVEVRREGTEHHFSPSALVMLQDIYRIHSARSSLSMSEEFPIVIDDDALLLAGVRKPRVVVDPWDLSVQVDNERFFLPPQPGELAETLWATKVMPCVQDTPGNHRTLRPVLRTDYEVYRREASDR